MENVQADSNMRSSISREMSDEETKMETIKINKGYKKIKFNFKKWMCLDELKRSNLTPNQEELVKRLEQIRRDRKQEAQEKLEKKLETNEALKTKKIQKNEIKRNTSALKRRTSNPLQEMLKEEGNRLNQRNKERQENPLLIQANPLRLNSHFKQNRKGKTKIASLSNCQIAISSRML